MSQSFDSRIRKLIGETDSELTDRMGVRAVRIVFKLTRLNIWYPTINGKDAYRDLSKLHGCTYLKADHPVFENQDDASLWAAEHGYTFEFRRGAMLDGPTDDALLDSVTVFDCREEIR